MHSYEEQFLAEMKKRGVTVTGNLDSPGGEKLDLSSVENLDEKMQMEVLCYWAELAFCAQSALNIKLGRNALKSVQKEWLKRKLPAILEEVLGQNDYWEYLRVAEFLNDFDADMLMAHLQKCAVHSNPEIQEIAVDFKN